MMNITEIYTGPLFVKTWAIELDKKTVLLVDPGGTDEDLTNFLEKIKPSKLIIMLTHGHFDHTGGVPELMQRYANTELLVHKEDAEYLGAGAKEVHIKCFEAIRAERYIKNFGYEFPAPTGFLNDGDFIYGFKVIHTPGHTEGSVCFWNKEDGVLFSGDTLFKRSHGRTDLYRGDEEKLKNSLKKLLSLPDNTAVYPGHGSNTVIGAERSWIESL